MNKTQNNRNRLYHLDLFRFLAALFVVFYHYGFRGFAKDNLSILEFPLIAEFSKYGYLGVNFFFIISGFVILLSAQSSNLYKFLVSRFTRLYPAFWFCVILSGLVIAAFGKPIFNVTLSQVLINLTMLNEFIGIESVDGVYWTLAIELKFYFLVALLIYVKQIKHIRVLCYILLLFAITYVFLPMSESPIPLKLLYYLTFPKWNSYFVAGMLFYLIKTGIRARADFIAIIISYVIAIYYAIIDVQYKNDFYDYDLSNITVVWIITLFFILFLLVSLGKLQFFNKKEFLSIGLLTYPLYLIHQNIGYIIFNELGYKINKWVLLTVTIIIMLIISYWINKYLEKPISSYLKKMLGNETLKKPGLTREI